jgi:hypothetical protein
VEFCCVVLIFHLSWVRTVSKPSKITLTEVILKWRRVAIELIWHRALVEFSVNWGSGSLSEWLPVEVFRSYLWNITCVARHMLGLNVLSGSTEPIIPSRWLVSIGQSLVLVVLSRRIWVEVSLRELWLAWSDFDVIVWWLVSCFSYNSVYVTRRASVDVVLSGNVACVAR